MCWFISLLNQCSVGHRCTMNEICELCFSSYSYFHSSCFSVHFCGCNPITAICWFSSSRSKSFIDIDPWHRLVEACFQRQSWGKSSPRASLCWHASGWKAFDYTRVFVFVCSLYEWSFTVWIFCFGPFSHDLLHIVLQGWLKNKIIQFVMNQVEDPQNYYTVCPLWLKLLSIPQFFQIKIKIPRLKSITTENQTLRRWWW